MNITLPSTPFFPVPLFMKWEENMFELKKSKNITYYVIFDYLVQGTRNDTQPKDCHSDSLWSPLEMWCSSLAHSVPSFDSWVFLQKKKINITSIYKVDVFSTYAKFPEKLTFLTPWYAHVYYPLAHIKEYSCLKRVIHQIDSKYKRLLFSASLTAKFELDFASTQVNAFY